MIIIQMQPMVLQVAVIFLFSKSQMLHNKQSVCISLTGIPTENESCCAYCANRGPHPPKVVNEPCSECCRETTRRLVAKARYRSPPSVTRGLFLSFLLLVPNVANKPCSETTRRSKPGPDLRTSVTRGLFFSFLSFLFSFLFFSLLSSWIIHIIDIITPRLKTRLAASAPGNRLHGRLAKIGRELGCYLARTFL